MLEDTKLLWSGSFLQACLAVHIDDIQLLLAHLGGLHVRNVPERIFNSTAGGQRMPSVMCEGNAESGDRMIPLGAYQALFQVAIQCAANMLGGRLVVEGIQPVDWEFDPRVLQAARPLGLTMDVEE